MILVTRDTDYGISYDGKFFLNDWLRLEFKERISQKRKIVLSDRLTEAFKLVAIPVSIEAEKEERKLVAEHEPETSNKIVREINRLLEELDRAGVAVANAKLSG